MKRSASIIIFSTIFLTLTACSFFDKTPPDVRIIFPQDNDTVATQLVVTGTSSDNVGVQQVFLRIDDGEYTEVEGVENWTSIIQLNSGMHYLTAKAVDFNKNSSLHIITVVGE